MMTAKDGRADALAEDPLMYKKKQHAHKINMEGEDETVAVCAWRAVNTISWLKECRGDLALTLLPISKPGLQNCLKYSQFLVFQASRRVANLSGHLETQSCGRQHVLLMRAAINHA